MIDPRLPSWAQNVSRETFLKLEQYAALLLKWNPKINLIGNATENDIWQRHLADSLQLLPLIPEPTNAVADLGSGAGLPGLVLAMARPEIAVHLIEHDQRKAAFLREVSAQLALTNVVVHATDIAKITARFECITARALTALPQLFALAYPLLMPASFCIFPKGENYAMELIEAEKNWQFKSQLTPSKTHEKSCIISVSELSPKDRH
jgi:16S rRNA (guanine527-N7)-methyltransferase